MDKLTFDEFCDNVQAELYDRLGDEYDISVDKYLKNNGVQLTGVIIRSKDSVCSPVIYLDDMYYHFMEDEIDLSVYVSNIIRFYERQKDCIEIDASMVYDFYKIKDGLFLKTINYEKNKEFLNDKPYHSFFDLASTFNVNIPNISDAVSSFVVTNNILEIWGISEDDLYEAAISNSEKLMPALVASLGEVLEKEFNKLIQDVYNVPMFLLTNKKYFYGASAILYPGVLKQVADSLKDDLVLMPSSVHEFIFVPYRVCYNASDLVELVRSVNATSVKNTDILGENIYLYSRADDSFTML